MSTNQNNSIPQNLTFLVYKLEADGSLKDISPNFFLESLISVNILVFYFPRLKHLHIWVGKNTAQDIQMQIANAEKIVLANHPDFTILRHFTNEQGKETKDFFSALNVDKSKVEARQKEFDNFRTKVYGDVGKLEIVKGNHAMIGKYDEAIEVAQKIIAEAEKVEDPTIIADQNAFIAEMEKKRERSQKKKNATQDIARLRETLEPAIVDKDYIAAHSMAEEIRSIYSDLLERKPDSDVQQLLDSEQEIYKEYLAQEEERLEIELQSQLVDIKQQIEDAFNQKVFESIDPFLFQLQDLVAKSERESTRQENEQYINETQTRKTEAQRIEQEREIIQDKIQAADNLTSKTAFDDAIEKLQEALNIAETDHITDLAESIQTQIDLINNQKNTHQKQLELLVHLIAHIEENEQQKQWEAAFQNCAKLLEIAPELDRQDLLESYQEKHEFFASQIEQLKLQAAQEQAQIQATLGELENIIQLDKNVLPSIENYSIEDLLGNLSGDLDEMFTQLDSLLDTQRVEIKTDVKSNAVIRSASGEVVEMEKVTTISETQPKSTSTENPIPSEPVHIGLASGLTNPFDDKIEEAILNDIIPYNFEITEVKLNGETPSEQPTETLTKDGLQMQWTLHDIPPKQSVDINYDLRNRVSRTIIVPMEQQLKIIKTHSDLHQLPKEGLYDAKLQFSNNFHTEIKGAVIEDIIPLNYVFEIKEPENEPHNDNAEAVGTMIKWNIHDFFQESAITHYYQLLELYRLETLKMAVHKRHQEAFDDLQKGSIKLAVEKYRQTVKDLEDYE